MKDLRIDRCHCPGRVGVHNPSTSLSLDVKSVSGNVQLLATLVPSPGLCKKLTPQPLVFPFELYVLGQVSISALRVFVWTSVKELSKS